MHQILTSVFPFWKSLQMFCFWILIFFVLSLSKLFWIFSLNHYLWTSEKALFSEVTFSACFSQQEQCAPRLNYIAVWSLDLLTVSLYFFSLKTTGTLLYFLLHSLLLLSQVASQNCYGKMSPALNFPPSLLLLFSAPVAGPVMPAFIYARTLGRCSIDLGTGSRESSRRHWMHHDSSCCLWVTQQDPLLFQCSSLCTWSFLWEE